MGLTIGILAAVNQGKLFDQVTRVLAVIVSSIPVFFLGLMLLLIFGVTLRWLPMGNRFPISISGEYTIWERIEHLILPTITLGSFSVATFSRFMRASLLDVLGQDYVRTARAKGLSDRLVWFRHASRNALIPIATLLGPAIPGVITGAVASLLIVTDSEVVPPALTAEQVYSRSDWSTVMEMEPQPDGVTVDWSSVTIQLRFTSLVYQPLLPSVPDTRGVIIGADGSTMEYVSDAAAVRPPSSVNEQLAV